MYSSLASLTEKGAAYVVEENAKKYMPVPLHEFCSNCIKVMENEKNWLLKNIETKKDNTESYITIEGENNILNKAKNLLSSAEERAYISCSADTLNLIEDEISCLIAKNLRVVILTDSTYALSGATVYKTDFKGNQIGIITDSKYVLTGEYGAGSANTCLYSGQKNFVLLFKTALSNEIKLIQYTKGVQTK